jgi:hypothetical protein
MSETMTSDWRELTDVEAIAECIFAGGIYALPDDSDEYAGEELGNYLTGERVLFIRAGLSDAEQARALLRGCAFKLAFNEYDVMPRYAALCEQCGVEP